MSLFRHKRKRWRVTFVKGLGINGHAHGHTIMRGTERGVRIMAQSMHPDGPSGHVRLVEIER